MTNVSKYFVLQELVLFDLFILEECAYGEQRGVIAAVYSEASSETNKNQKYSVVCV